MSIHILVLCASQERKEFQIAQFRDLKRKCNVTFFQAYTPSNSSDYMADCANAAQCHAVRIAHLCA